MNRFDDAHGPDRQAPTPAVGRRGGQRNVADSFCAGTTCTITKIYDQTANHDDLPISWGGYWTGPGPNGSGIGADATALPLTEIGQC